MAIGQSAIWDNSTIKAFLQVEPQLCQADNLSPCLSASLGKNSLPKTRLQTWIITIALIKSLSNREEGWVQRQREINKQKLKMYLTVI